MSTFNGNISSLKGRDKKLVQGIINTLSHGSNQLLPSTLMYTLRQQSIDLKNMVNGGGDIGILDVIVMMIVMVGRKTTNAFF